MQHITPCLWFDTQAEEAMNFYVSAIPDSKMGLVTYYSEGMPMKKGTVLTATATLKAQEFMGLNGGPVFKHSPATSFILHCDTQDEIDTLWEKMSEGGEKSQCGWVTDKFGLSWQIAPTMMRDIFASKNERKIASYMQAVMGMKKLDIKTLQQAFDNG